MHFQQSAAAINDCHRETMHLTDSRAPAELPTGRPAVTKCPGRRYRVRALCEPPAISRSALLGAVQTYAYVRDNTLAGSILCAFRSPADARCVAATFIKRHLGGESVRPTAGIYYH